MTYEQIIKALECCKIGECDDCPFYDVKEDCEVELPEEALDLINRQKAEIERLETGSVKDFNQWDMLTEKTKQHYADLYNEAKDSLKSEAIKEFADKINALLARYSHLHNNAENASQDTIEAVDGTDIEMQSVWDVFTLKNNEMAEYEEMSRLQENIETIASERLLKEIEKDFRLLVKEMTEVHE